MAQLSSIYPSQKVTAGAIAGALSIILVWAMGQFFNVHVPAEVASAFTPVMSFLVSYVVPPNAGDLKKPP